MVEAFLFVPHILIPPVWDHVSRVWFDGFDREHFFKTSVDYVVEAGEGSLQVLWGVFQPSTEFGVCYLFPCMPISLLKKSNRKAMNRN